MKTVSAAYKEQMKKPMRNPGRIAVSIDLVSVEAMENAVYSGGISGESKYSVTDHIFDKDRPTVTYAAFEDRLLRADGSLRFLYEDQSPQPDDGGFIGKGYSPDGVEVSFHEPSRVKGITIGLGSDAVTKLKVTFEDSGHNVLSTYESDVLYPNNPAYPPGYNDLDGYTWAHEWDDWIENVSYAEVEQTFQDPISGASSRIKFVWFGIKADIAERKILKATIDSHESPIVETLPQTDVTVEVINLNNEFTYDDTTSMVHSLETRQPLRIKVGYTLDDKSVEWLDMGRFSISDWTVTRSLLTIHATDIFRTMDAPYYGGGWTWTMPEDAVPTICGDYGIQCATVDAYKSRVYASFPPSSHAECLQLIAGASFNRMYQDPKTGNIILSKLEWISPQPVLTLEANDIYDDAFTDKNERVKEVRVTKTTLKVPDGDSAQEFEGITAEAGDTMAFTWSGPGRTKAAAVGKTAVTFRDLGLYCTEVVFPNAVTNKTLTITRTEYNEAKTVSVRSINPSGITIEWDNPLIYSPNYLALILAKYYGDGVLTYDFSYRGNPELECGDVIYYTTETGKKALMRIEDLTFEFNGAFRGHIRGRCL